MSLAVLYMDVIGNEKYPFLEMQFITENHYYLLASSACQSIIFYSLHYPLDTSGTQKMEMQSLLSHII